ncbi:MAG: radical SAM protein [Myxococcales bacterium]|nr:radical SAM protein [Myxococcales bacterium]
MPAARRLDVLTDAHHPRYVVWELTLACDQPCTHCGSRAGTARPRELDRAEALDVVRQLAAMGTREVVLIGGEAYLHPAYLDVARALTAAGVRASMTTGGAGVTPALAAEMKAAGLALVSVSVDGLAPSHDLVRANRGSFARALAALAALRAAGLDVAANTNINRVNLGELEALYPILRDAGVRGWQLQLTVPLGRGADRPDLILQPYELVELFARLAALKERAWGDGVTIFSANNLGYFGPEEGLLRSTRPDELHHFQGCVAGRYAMGIESDGAIKGCPSLQTDSYVGGNVRATPLVELWQTPALAFARARTDADRWGFCATCAFGDVCMSGCTFTAHALLGRPGNNPYCAYRAQQLAGQGLRERLVPVADAPGAPFDNGRFELVVEPLDAPTAPTPPPQRLVQIRRREA